MGRRCVSVPRPPSSRVVVYQHRARARGSAARGTADERRSTFPIPPLCAAVVTARRWQRRAARGCTGRQEQRVGEGGRGGGGGRRGHSAQGQPARPRGRRTRRPAPVTLPPAASPRSTRTSSKCQSSKKVHEHIVIVQGPTCAPVSQLRACAQGRARARARCRGSSPNSCPAHWRPTGWGRLGAAAGASCWARRRGRRADHHRPWGRCRSTGASSGASLLPRIHWSSLSSWGSCGRCGIGPPLWARSARTRLQVHLVLAVAAAARLARLCPFPPFRALTLPT